MVLEAIAAAGLLAAYFRVVRHAYETNNGEPAGNFVPARGEQDSAQGHHENDTGSSSAADPH